MLTNLLPPERKKTLKRAYVMRLSATAFLLLSFLVISLTLLQSPILLFKWNQVQALKSEEARSTQELGTIGSTEAGGRIKMMNDNLVYLARLSTTTSAVETVTMITNLPYTDVRLTGLSYTPSAKGAPGKMIVNGTAATREALQRYVNLLRTIPLVTGADLPISTFAKESDIPFSIALTGTF